MLRGMILTIALTIAVGMGAGGAGEVSWPPSGPKFDEGTLTLGSGKTLDLGALGGSYVVSDTVTISGGTLVGDSRFVFGTMGGLKGLVGAVTALLGDLGLDLTSTGYNYNNTGFAGLLELVDAPVGSLISGLDADGLSGLLGGILSGIFGTVDDLLTALGLTSSDSGLLKPLLEGLGLPLGDLVSALLDPNDGAVPTLLLGTGAEANGIMNITSGTLNTSKGTLNLVAGEINLSGATTVGTNGFNILGNLNLSGTVTGDLKINSLEGAFRIVDDLTVTGSFMLNDLAETAVTFSHDVKVGSNLVSDAGLTITIASGTTTTVGGTYIDNGGILNLAGNLIFTGNTTLNSGEFVAQGGILGVGAGKTLGISGSTLDTTTNALWLQGDVTIGAGTEVTGTNGLAGLGNLTLEDGIDAADPAGVKVLGTAGDLTVDVGATEHVQLGAAGTETLTGKPADFNTNAVGGTLLLENGILDLINDIKAGAYGQTGGTLNLAHDIDSDTTIIIEGGAIKNGAGSLQSDGDGILLADAAVDLNGATLKLLGKLVQFGEGLTFTGTGAGGTDISVTGDFAIRDGDTFALNKILDVIKGMGGNGDVRLGNGSTLRIETGAGITADGRYVQGENGADGTLILAGGSSLEAKIIDILGGILRSIKGSGGETDVTLKAADGMNLSDAVLDVTGGTNLDITGDVKIGDNVATTGDGTGKLTIDGDLTLDNGLDSLGGLDGLDVTVKNGGKIKDSGGNSIDEGEYDMDDNAFTSGDKVIVTKDPDGTIHITTIAGKSMEGNIPGLTRFMSGTLDKLGVSADSRGFMSDDFVGNAYYAAAMTPTDYNKLDGDAKENVRLLSALLTDAPKGGFDAPQLTSGEALAVGQSLSGQVGAMSTVVGANTAKEAANVVGGRVDALRMEVGAANELNAADAFPSACYYDPCAATSINRFWVSGFGLWEDADNYEGYAGYKYNSGGMMIGYDRFLNQNFAVGGSFGYTNGSFENKMALGNDSEIESYSVNAYGGFFHSSGFFASAHVGYTYSDNDMSVMRTYANGWEDMENSTNSWYTGAAVGYDWRPSETLALTFTPSIGLYYYHSAGSAFTSSKGIEYDEQKRSTWSLPIDIAASYDIGICEDSVLTLGAHIGYAYDFSGKGTSTTATIKGVPGSFASMSVEGRRPGQHQLNLGTNAKYAWKQFEVGAKYDYFHRAEYDAHRLSGTFAVNF